VLFVTPIGREWFGPTLALFQPPHRTTQTGESLKITIRRLVQGATITGMAVSMMAAAAGQTVGRGKVTSNLVAESLTLSLVGGALLGFGMLRRKKRKEDTQC
jgi:hypothetical protein